MKKHVSYLLILLLIASSISLIGCSITGWTSKNIADGSNIGTGNTVAILTKDGAIFIGEYRGIQDIPFSEYSEIYKSTVSETILDPLLPRVGETIQVTTKIAQDRFWEGQFISFDPVNITVRLKGKSEADKFYISSLTTVSNTRGNKLRTMQLRKMYEDGNIPLKSAIVIKNGSNSKLIPVNTIEEIMSDQTIALKISNDMVKSGINANRLMKNLN